MRGITGEEAAGALSARPALAAPTVGADVATSVATDSFFAHAATSRRNATARRDELEGTGILQKKAGR
jgi:hypothetical protein